MDLWSRFCGPVDDANECKIKFSQIGSFLIFATLSAFYFGRRRNVLLRNKTQMYCINIRIFATCCLAGIPPVKLYLLLINSDSPPDGIAPVDLLSCCYQTITMIVHASFLLSLRSHGTYSARGPLSLVIVWLIMLVILAPLTFSESLPVDRINDLVTIGLNILYGLCLLPSGKSVLVSRSNTAEEERQVLLGNEYVRFQQHPDDIALGPAQSRASLISLLYFSWVNPLIRIAVERRLQSINDLFALPESISLTRITEKFQQNIDRSRTLFQALHSSFGREFYLIGLLRLIADSSGFAGPLLLGGLLRSEFNESSRFQSEALLYAGGLFLAAILASYCGVHFNWRISVVTIKMRIAMVSAIYRKSLEARGLRSARPEVLNLMSTDTDRIVNSCISFHSFWSIPLQLFVSLYLLYTQVGAAFTAGLLFAVILIPINKFIASKIGQLSGELMSRKDERVLTTSEVLHGARQIKLNAWERIFVQKIEALRREEVIVLGKRKYLDALCVYFWATTPVLMCLLTFGVAAITGQQLTAATIYTSVALLNMLIGPLNSFPWVLNGLMEAWVSLKRVQELIDLPNLDLTDFYHPVQNRKSTSSSSKLAAKPVVLSMRNASFEFHSQQRGGAITISSDGETSELPALHTAIDDKTTSSEPLEFCLSNISFQVKRGDLICITGNVGSGKSALLSAITGDLNCVRGSICLQDVTTGFGYVSQNAWLQRGTIRNNIVWGQVYDEHFYNTVVHACGLADDLEQLGGDDTFVGDKGMTLSGGQRMRVALARAVYQRKQIYLLDDILSSLDAHVANHVIKYCIFGLLANRTRLIVTSQRNVMRRASQILHFDQGQVTVHDSAKAYTSDLSDDDEEGQEEGAAKDAEGSLDSRQFGIRRSGGHGAVGRRKGQSNIERQAEGEKSSPEERFEEGMELGELKKSTLTAYWRAVTGRLGTCVLLSVLLMQLSRNYSDVLLAQWVAVATDNTTDPVTSSGSLMAIYSSVVILNSILTLVRSFLFAYAGIRAAIFIHDRLLKGVIYAKFRFFDITPVGRILNRFSSDTYTVDDNLPFMLNILLAQVFGLLGAIATTLFALPWVTIVVVPMLPIYLSVQQRYRRASRNIKRLASNALSPLYSHFTETLEGLTTIRAMRASARFSADFLVMLENSARTQLTSSAAQCWLSIRLQLLGSVLIGGCSVVAALTGAHVTNAGYVGLAISYALSITSLLSGVLNAVAETELELVAVERVNEYCQLKGEEREEGDEESHREGEGVLGVVEERMTTTPYGWPCQGVIKFDKVSLHYGRGEGGGGETGNSLKSVSFETEACEKVGIVGRTGAGKTSILSALLRTHAIERGGSITIDSVPLASVRLAELRDRIAYVAQDPFLFRGTVRENLDPLNHYYESHIWNGLTKCLTSPLILSLGGLNGRIEMRGENLSTGQKQLLCLTRAFLKKAKVLCIDEGTAHLDRDSEAAIQNVLRTVFGNSTVVQIAHRLQNVRGMDRVLVMRDGVLVECDSPAVLEGDKGSLFSQMLREQTEAK